MQPSKFTPEFFNELGLEHLPAHIGVVVTHVLTGEIRAEFQVQRSLLAPNGYTTVALAAWLPRFFSLTPIIRSSKHVRITRSASGSPITITFCVICRISCCLTPLILTPSNGKARYPVRVPKSIGRAVSKFGFWNFRPSLSNWTGARRGMPGSYWKARWRSISKAVWCSTRRAPASSFHPALQPHIKHAPSHR